MQKLTAVERGTRAGAQGVTECPYTDAGDRAVWEAARAAAEHRTHSQQDAFGHPPHFPPRLCISDATKVCICCDRCQRDCRAETAQDVSAQPISWQRVLWALPRIATSIELMITRESVHTRTTVCTTCGSRIAVARGCPTCGASS